MLNFFYEKKRKIFYDCYYQCSYVINRFYTRESLNFFPFKYYYYSSSLYVCMYFLLMIIM